MGGGGEEVLKTSKDNEGIQSIIFSPNTRVFRKSDLQINLCMEVLTVSISGQGNPLTQATFECRASEIAAVVDTVVGRYLPYTDVTRKIQHKELEARHLPSEGSHSIPSYPKS